MARLLVPGQDDKKIVPEGLKASAMNSTQQAMLLDLIAEWVGILNETSAAARIAEMKADLNETWVAWSGPTTGQAGSNITAYYRIQGPHLVILLPACPVVGPLHANQVSFRSAFISAMRAAAEVSFRMPTHSAIRSRSMACCVEFIAEALRPSGTIFLSSWPGP